MIELNLYESVFAKMKNFLCPAQKSLPRARKSRAALVAEELEALYPAAECALSFEGDPFRLLIMARLSAQCTDKRVNQVSEHLFAAFPDVYAMAKAPLSEIEAHIRSCGLYQMKAKNILECSQILVEQYDGKVPADKKALLSLPGVGEKIANLMLGDVFGDPHIVADTHCIRIANRLGLAASENPSQVVKSLEAIVPKAEQSSFCHRIVWFGREICRAQSPRCADCPLCGKIESKNHLSGRSKTKSVT